MGYERAANNGGLATNVHGQQHTYLDAKVQIHRLVNEAFATYDRLQQVFKEQIPLEGQNLEEIRTNSTLP